MALRFSFTLKRKKYGRYFFFGISFFLSFQIDDFGFRILNKSFI